MIEYQNSTFYLQTKKTSYWFSVTDYGHLEHVYFGESLPIQPAQALGIKRTTQLGSSIQYRDDDPLYTMDAVPLEYSGIGQGDYRESPLEVRLGDGRFCNDFVYDSHQIFAGVYPGADEIDHRPPGSVAVLTHKESFHRGVPRLRRHKATDISSRKWEKTKSNNSSQLAPGVTDIQPGHRFFDVLPAAYGDTSSCQTLVVTLKDKTAALSLDLVYTVFPETDVITRQTVIHNLGIESAQIEHLSSMMVDIPNRDFQVLSLHGGWIKESHASIQKLTVGSFTFGSNTGSSSNQHNPGCLVFPSTTTQNYGPAYGFNLVYSGNHRTSVELSPFGLVRIANGINPQGFSWPLEPGEAFTTPQAVLTFSPGGLNGVSDNFHRFVRQHIQPKRYFERERPVIYNGWEARFFDFTEQSQLKLARKAKNLGVELFVVDDGWFKERNDDTAGLGNFEVDSKKFPTGLGPFAKKINDLGMEFGLWFEPEMANLQSELSRKHPEWIMQIPGIPAKTGRNQYVLDLCNPEVCDYLVDKVGKVLDSANITYVKWDMNRHMADVYSPSVPDQGMVFHRYICNLYQVIERIFSARPHILLETCSSGGNRFDLGMLAYSAMIWSSDDTDPIERLEIQQGLSYFYPLCSISAHVSNSPHQQTLRATSLSTRFNVACFGSLGYEYDLDLLNHEEIKEIQEQIRFYKRYRKIFQFGQFIRHDPHRPDLFQWQVIQNNLAIAGNFQTHIGAAPAPDYLRIIGLDSDRVFSVHPKPQRIPLERFGALIHHVLPIKLDPRGALISAANRYYSLPDALEEYEGTGSLLAQGIYLNSQFMGTYHNDKTRLLGDFGSTLYVAQPVLKKRAK